LFGNDLGKGAKILLQITQFMHLFGANSWSGMLTL